jgi:hypothetical protein
MRVFVPVEDAPGTAFLGLLVPYRCGLACEHAMREQSDSGSRNTARSAATEDREPARALADTREFMRR